MDNPNLFNLAGKIALVTGGSRGMGREICLAYAAAGAEVIIVSRKIESCQALALEIKDRYGRAAHPYACHVGDWDAVTALSEQVYERLGRIDVLVNNAGMSPLYEDLTDVTEALYDKVFDVNLKGPFRLSVLVGTRMAKGAGGSIINVSSTGSIRSRAGIIPYASAKAGLNSMTEGLARSFGPTVRVNCIMAGPFLTDISKAWDMDAFNERAKDMALQRGGRPDEIVGAALYFGSEASSFCTGAILRLDGGMP